MRKLFFWLHLAAGSVAGIVIFIMCVTGVLLAFEKQTVEWADRAFRHSPPAATSKRLPVEALLERVLASGNPTPSGFTVRSEPDAPASAEFGREKVVYINPWTGSVLGEGSQTIRAFFRETENWHRWLAVGLESRPMGRAFTGYSNLIFLFILCSGLYLWLPRVWTWRHLRPAVWFRSGLRGKARDWNWHNAAGLWSFAPLFLIVLTAVVMSFPWANDLVYKANGEQPPARGGRGGGGGRGGPTGRVGDPASVIAGLNTAWAAAEAQDPNWKIITMRLGTSPKAPVTFQLDAGNGRPDLRSQLTVNRQTGAVRSESFSANTPGRRLRTWIRFTHTGEAGGIPGRAIAAIASAAGTLLVYTGLALALRRLFAYLKRNRQGNTVDNEAAVTVA